MALNHFIIIFEWKSHCVFLGHSDNAAHEFSNNDDRQFYTFRHTGSVVFDNKYFSSIAFDFRGTHSVCIGEVGKEREREEEIESQK